MINSEITTQIFVRLIFYFGATVYIWDTFIIDGQRHIDMGRGCCPHCGVENSVDWISYNTITRRTAVSYSKLEKKKDEYFTSRKCFSCGKKFYIAGGKQKDVSKK